MKMNYLLVSNSKIYLKQTDDIEEVLFDFLGPAWFKYIIENSNYIGLNSQLYDSPKNIIASELFKDEIFGDCIIIQEDNLEHEYHSVQADFIKKYQLEIINEIQE